MKLRLSWTDPVSHRPRRPLLAPPIALGQAFTAMPKEISGQSVSRMVIGDRKILDFQALLVEIEGELYLIDNGGQTYVNQQQVSGQERLNPNDRIRIGQTELQLQILETPQNAPDKHSTHFQTVQEATIEPSAAASPVQQNGNSNGYANNNGHANSNGHANNNGSHLDYPAQFNLPHQGMTEPPHIDLPQTHFPKADPERSRNGNHKAQPQPIAPEPNPSPALSNNATPASDRATPRSNQQPPFIPQPNEHQPQSNGHDPSNGIANPAPAQSQPTVQILDFQAAIPDSTATPNPLQLPGNSPNAGCSRKVGFLFKRPCDRANSTGCNHCANGYSNHAYSADYSLYEGFGHFEPGTWGYGLLKNHGLLENQNNA